MNNLHDVHFTFNTTGSPNVKDNFKLFLDDKGNIIDRGGIEYGIYNKVLSLNFNFTKTLLIKRHHIGLGDVIDWVTNKLYIKDLIMYLTNGKCGCEQRRIKFNNWFKFYWFTFKLRETYFNDHHYTKINQNKLTELKETVLSTINKMKDQDKEVSKTDLPTNPILKKPNPPKTGCGCSKAKKVIA